MKLVIRDYFTAFRSGRAKTDFNSNFLFIYVLVIMPLPFNLFGRGMGKIAEFYVTALVILYVLFAAPYHPVTLPKIMYLCPLDDAEKYTYIVKSYLFKVLFPVGIAMCVIGTLCVTGIMKSTHGILLIISVAGLSVNTSLLHADRIAACIGKKQSALFYGGTDGWETFATVVSVCVCLFLLYDSALGEDVIMGIVLVCMVFLELPLTIKVARRIRPTLDAMMHYER